MIRNYLPCPNHDGSDGTDHKDNVNYIPIYFALRLIHKIRSVKTLT